MNTATLGEIGQSTTKLKISQDVKIVNIYRHIKKALYELECIFTDISNLDNESILLSISNSWGIIHKYIKNIEPDWTNKFNERLIKIYDIRLYWRNHSWGHYRYDTFDFVI